MKRTLLITIIAFTLICPAAYSAAVYYDDPLAIGVGARPVGMGRAYVAIADDSNAIFMNPGGLGSQKSINGTSMATNLLNEYNYTMLAGVYPTKDGVYGLGYVASRIGGILVTGGGETDFANQALVLSYGRYIGGELAQYLGKEHEIYGGASFKYFSKGFSGDAQASGAGFNFDLGMKYVYSRWLSYGLKLENVFYGSKISGDIAPEDMPFLIKFGAAFNWTEHNLLISLDKDLFIGREVPWPMHLGAEWRAHEYLTLRIGFDQVAGSNSGGDLSTNTTFGVGTRYDGFMVDVSFVQTAVETNISSSFLSISFDGGPLFAGEKKKKAEQPAPAPVKAQEATVEAAPISPKVSIKPVIDKIQIITPQDKTYTFDGEITFSGRADQDVQEIWINDNRVQVNADGSFSGKIPLSSGQNNVKVRIRDAAGNEGIIPMSLARYYKPKDKTTQEAKSEYIDKVIIQSKVHDYLGKDYSTNDYVSREALETILSKIRKMKQNEAK